MEGSGNRFSLMWSFVFLLALPQSFILAGAQAASQEKVWGAAVYNLYGESTPYAFASPRTLTPLGARQLFGAGSAFRSRYLTGNADTNIHGINVYRLDDSQLSVSSLM